MSTCEEMCGEFWRMIENRSCWTEDLIILGSDVVSLFPSLSATLTGKAVKEQIIKSTIQWENIDWNLLTLYLKINEGYWKNCQVFDSIKMLLQKKKSNIGRPASVTTKDLEKKYIWSSATECMSQKTKSKLIGLAMEYAIWFFFNHFCYTFAGENYRQTSGGPIGARLTMAVARLVMQSWKENFNEILKNSEISELLSALYVDDGRSVQRKLCYGERFSPEKNAIVYSESLAEVDINDAVDKNELTRREMLNAMNSVNKDLQFTMELVDDFEDHRLPTLSFTMWPTEEGIAHSYFEKQMRNQVLLVERSAMGKQSLFAILSNELRRRLEVLDEKLPLNEKIQVVNKFTQQLVNSEFAWKQIREIVTSALIGHVRREKRRKDSGKKRYRSGKESLNSRVEKKLLEKYQWFKKKREKEENASTSDPKNGQNPSKIGQKTIKGQIKSDNGHETEDKDVPKAVIFVPFTVDSKLAKEIRNVIQSLKPWTGIELKVVERAGERLEEILHKSNPWENADCERDICKPCESSSKSENPSFKNCKKRSVVYRTYCNTCKVNEIKKLSEHETGENKNEKKRKRGEREIDNIKLFTYIGETSRSAMERGAEHMKDLEFHREKSHMLKHIVEFHPDSDPSEIEFKMEIISSHKSAFERQLREAVLIERNLGLFSMNSKLEYSRTVIPTIKIKMGNKSEKEDPHVVREKVAVEKIKNMRKMHRKRDNDNVNIEEVDNGYENSAKRVKIVNNEPPPNLKPTLNRQGPFKLSDYSNIATVSCSYIESNGEPNKQYIQPSDPLTLQ